MELLNIVIATVNNVFLGAMGTLILSVLMVGIVGHFQNLDKPTTVFAV
jgi:hypothetical protein